MMNLTDFMCFGGFKDNMATLLETGQFADARLVCFDNDGNGEEGGERKRVEIPVHRAILAASSEFFADEFNSGVQEVVVPEEFSSAMIRALLSYVYIGYYFPEKTPEPTVEMYEAAEFYGLDIFEKEPEEGEMVIYNFPTEKQPGPKEFDGDLDTCMGYCEMRMEMQKGKKGKNLIRMDFKLGRKFEDTLAADLSLSLLNSVGEKLKTVKREGIFCGSIEWKNCLDYHKIANEKFFQYNREFNETTKRYNRLPFLSVLYEATLISPKQCDPQFEKLLDTGVFSDARIVFLNESGEKEVVNVHKVILAARSKFFAMAFSGGMREAETGEVVVAPELGFSPDTIRAMLSYIYTGTIPSGLEQPALIALFKAAHFYQIGELVTDCVKLLQVTIDECAEFLMFADTYACRELMAKSLYILRTNTERVKQTRGWRRLMESDNTKLKTLLGDWLCETPVSMENYWQLFRMYDDYKFVVKEGEFEGAKTEVDTNDELLKRAMEFVAVNAEAIWASKGWRQLMESKNKHPDTDPKAFYKSYLWSLPGVSVDISGVKISVECCVFMFRLASAFDDEVFRKRALQTMVENCEAVEETEGWRRS